VQEARRASRLGRIGCRSRAFGMVGRCSRLDHHTVLAMVHLVDEYTV
jgi:hypothetical protein